jgi:hypothetical protein
MNRIFDGLLRDALGSTFFMALTLCQALRLEAGPVD